MGEDEEGGEEERRGHGRDEMSEKSKQRPTIGARRVDAGARARIFAEGVDGRAWTVRHHHGNSGMTMPTTTKLTAAQKATMATRLAMS